MVVTSALRRTIETADLLVGNGVPRRRTRLCNERNFGVMEGLTWDDVQHLDPPVLFIEVGNDRHSVNPKDGEPFEDVWDRAKRFRRMLFREYQGKRVLVVSHGVFLQMFHGVLRGTSCIEALAAYPGSLELTCFSFTGDRLEDEKTIRLGKSEPVRW